MIYKLIAKGSYVLEKVINTNDYETKCVDTIIDAEEYYLRKEYGKKYYETCNTLIVKELRRKND